MTFDCQKIVRELEKQGKALYEEGDYEGAKDAYSAALAIDPEGADISITMNLAACYIELFQLAIAQNLLERVVKQHPDNERAHYYLGILLLLQGNFERGWTEYEWIENIHNKINSLPSQHKWKGGSLQGKNIVLWDEQGFGDSLQFIRFAPMLKLLGGQVFLDIKPPLRRLIKGNPHLGLVMDSETSVQTHWWSRLMSLPKILNCNTPESIPRKVPYINPLPEIEAPKVVLSTPKRKIGLVWQGNPQNVKDSIRSIGLSQYRPLFNVEECTFFSLQHISCAAEAAQSGLTDRIVDLAQEIEDFADLASIIAQLDLVISVDTAVAHLAGAMGKPVWVLVPFMPDWRWLLERQDSLWYPTMRLFRQTSRHDWVSVITEMSKRLAGGHSPLFEV